MKTKHILTALALPAMFAACTAEDIVSENNALQQDARAKLSKDFVLNINNGVESRYAVESNGAGLKFVNEEGDLIGANLIDQYNPHPDYKDKPETWTITAYVAPSLPFKNVAGNEWKSDAELGVGNYLFTYPFNAKDNGRGAAQFELPRVQKYSSANENSIVAANNKAVGAVVLTEGQTEVVADLKNLYTYPKFIINFDNGVDVKKVTKVVLKKQLDASDKGFVYKGGIHHQAVAEMFRKEAKAVEALMTADKKLSKEEAELKYWAQFETSHFIIDKVNTTIGSDTYVDDEALAQYGAPQYSNYLTVEMDEPVKANATTNNKSVSVRIMMPSVADLSASNGLKMYVVTDNGTYDFDVWANVEADGDIINGDLVFSTDDPNKVKTALSRSKSNTLRTKNLNSTDKATDLGYIVTTAADWNALVETTAGATKQIPVELLNSEFALTKDLNMPKNTLGFKISSPVSVEGAVTLSNIDVDNTITVKKGATLTTSATFLADAVEVKEEGNLVFAAKVNSTTNKVEAYTGVTAVTNYGTVAVPAGVEATFSLTNEGTLNVGEAASRAAVAVANIYGSNDGIINNNGTLTIVKGQTFINNAPTEDKGYEYDLEEEAWISAPTVNNNGTFESKGSTTNNGLFINADKLTSNFGSASFTNANAASTPAYKATLEVKDKAFTFIDNNSAVIVLAKHTPADFTIYVSNTGKIKHTATEKEIDLSASPVNHLIATGDVTLKKTYVTPNTTTVNALTTLEMIGGGKITVTATTAKLTNLVITEGKSAIDNDFTITSVKIAEGAELTIPKGKKLSAEGSELTGWLEAEGTLYIDGTLNVAGYEYAATSTPKDDLIAAITSGDLNIELGKESAVTATKETTVGALENVVKIWWNLEKKNNGNYFNLNIGQNLQTTNPYDTQVFANAIFTNKALAEEGFATAVATLFNASNWNLATDKQTAAEILKKLEANYETFASAVTTHIIGTNSLTDAQKVAEKAKYIQENGSLLATMAAKVAHETTVYASKDRAMKALIGKLIADANPTFAEFQTAKVAYSLLTANDLYTALEKTVLNAVPTLNTDQSGWVSASATWTANFAYVWAEATCPLYEVVDAADEYKLTDWNKVWEVPSSDQIANDSWTYANIAAWINAASIYSDDATTKTMAKKYYNKDFKYIDTQVANVAAKLAE